MKELTDGPGAGAGDGAGAGAGAGDGGDGDGVGEGGGEDMLKDGCGDWSSRKGNKTRRAAVEGGWSSGLVSSELVLGGVSPRVIYVNRKGKGGCALL